MKKKINKFRGFRISAYFGHLIALKRPIHVVYNPSRIKFNNSERIVYAGCIHGGNNQIFKRLEKLIINPPDYLIFTGDITGTPEIERMKKYFYDEKEKHPKVEFSSYEFFGNWAELFSREKRQELLQNLEFQAEMLLVIIQRLKKLGVKIYILEGNWDSREKTGIKSLARADIKNVFDVPKFFSDSGFKFIKKIKTLETKTTLQILMPFMTIFNFQDLSKKEINLIIKAVERSRKSGKDIILVGHAEANWKVHHLVFASTASGERSKVIANFGRAMAIFQPDEVIYPHQHGRIRDEKGELINIDSKYILEVNSKGVRLLDEPTFKKNKRQILVSYVPMGFLAEEDNRIYT